MASMEKGLGFFRNLSIAWKMAFSFGGLGLLFLIVVLLYHYTLFSLLDHTRHLLDKVEARKSLAMEIYGELLEARRREKDFLLRLDPKHIPQVREHVDAIHVRTKALGLVEEPGEEVHEEIDNLIVTYHEAFLGLVASMERHGFTPGTGLQGEFRAVVHEVEEILKDFDTAPLKIELGEMRRHEKDFVVRRDAKYMEKFQKHLAAFRDHLEKSTLTKGTRELFTQPLAAYQEAVENFSTFIQDAPLDTNDSLYKSMSKTAHELETILAHYYVPGISVDLLTARRYEKDYLLREDDKYINGLLRTLETMRTKLAASGVEEAMRARILDRLTIYEKTFLELTKQDVVVKEHLETMRQAAHAIEPLVVKTEKSARERMSQASVRLEEESNQRAMLALAMAMGIFLFGAILAVIISRGISRPMRDLALLAERVAGGDLRVAVDFKRQDEVGQLGQAMNRMASHLKEMISEILANAEHLEASSQEMVAVATQMTAGTRGVMEQATTTAAAAEQTSENMGNISAAMTQASGNLNAISDLVGHANAEMGAIAAAVEEASANLNTVASSTEQASAGLKGVTGATDRMNRNVRTAAESVRVVTGSFGEVRQRCQAAENESREATGHVRETARVMEKLAESASQIDQVVELITGIADQTNMLALNASIEAAGAGDAGKGFAVVANEVKALAHQTSESTSQIEERTREIQKQSAGALDATRRVTEIIRRIGEANRGILQSVDLQATSADRVSVAMEAVAGETEGVSRQVAESSSGLVEVARNVMEVSSGIMEVSRAVSGATTGLSRVANNVQEAVGGVGEIRQDVEEAAAASQSIAHAMAEINQSSREMEVLSASVDKGANLLAKLATGIRGLVGRFQM